LDKDRWSNLAVRAYAKGLVSLNEAERSDDRWKLREAVLLSEVEREALMQMHAMVHLEECSAAQYSGGNDIFKYYRDQAREQYAGFVKLAMPYSKVASGIAKSTMDTLADLWKETFGDPNDPEVAATIEKDIEAMKQGNSGEYDA